MGVTAVASDSTFERDTANDAAWRLQKVAEFVQDKKLQALLSGGQLIDWNLEPDRTAWWVVAGMMNYYADGGFYPEGGSHRIAEAIIPIIERAGGRVLCRAKVDAILVDDSTTAYGEFVWSEGSSSCRVLI